MSGPANTVLLSSFDDDPFVGPPEAEAVPLSFFTLDSRGKPVGLEGPRVKVVEPANVLKATSLEAEPQTPNPWKLPTPDDHGNFVYSNEALFPELNQDPRGNWVVEDGLHLAQANAFRAVNEAFAAADDWADRPLTLGQNGPISVHLHQFAHADAFAESTLDRIELGVVPFWKGGKQVLFDVATSAEVVTHEAGHIVHLKALKPHLADDPDAGAWAESFADQFAKWVSLRDDDRVDQVLGETGGDLTRSNALSKEGEGLSKIRDENVRDAAELTVLSQFPLEDVWRRGNVFTGAAYALFVSIVQDLIAGGKSPEQAVAAAGHIAGTFAVRANDYMPEESPTLEAVGHAYLKVDKEHFEGRHGGRLAQELIKREIFDTGSVSRWQAHEAGMPALTLPPDADPAAALKLVRENRDVLGVVRGFEPSVDELVRDAGGNVRLRFLGGATENHRFGLLTFKSNGALIDYHPPTRGFGGALREGPRELEAETAPRARLRRS